MVFNKYCSRISTVIMGTFFQIKNASVFDEASEWKWAPKELNFICVKKIWGEFKMAGSGSFLVVVNSGPFLTSVLEVFMAIFGQLCTILTDFDQSWPILADLGQSWLVPVHLCRSLFWPTHFCSWHFPKYLFRSVEQMGLELKFVFTILMRGGQVTQLLSCYKTAPDTLRWNEVARDFYTRIYVQNLII